MKPIFQLSLTGFIALLFFTGCVKDIDFKGEIIQPLLVMNSFITPDSVLKAHISKSKFFLSSNETSVISNADISVYINGQSEGKMAYIGNGFYELNHKPAVGDVVRFVVDAPNMKSVWSETPILPKVEILSVDTVGTVLDSFPIYRGGGYGIDEPMEEVGMQYRVDYRFHVKFKDPVGVNNYYRLMVYRKSLYSRDYYEYYSSNDMGPQYHYDYIELPAEPESFYYDYNFNFDDIVATGNQTELEIITGSYNLYNTFLDELIDGKDYSLTFSVTGFKYRYFPDKKPDDFTPDEIHVDLQTVSKDYFYYLKTVEANDNNSGNPFAEPVQIYNNINDGIGILGAYTSNRREKIVISF